MNDLSEEEAAKRKLVAIPHSIWEQLDNKGYELDPNRVRWLMIGCNFEVYPCDEGYVYSTSVESDGEHPWPGLFDHISD